jgi:choline dehydrogenase
VPETYDVIVVGGGSAGCIVAAEIARHPGTRVLLLERGEPAEANPETLTADGYKHAFANDRVILERFTVRQRGCGDRRLFAGTGMGMGGSGSVNGMVYTRGSVLDYDEWPEGWRWADLVPDFESMERTLGVRPRGPTEFTEACIAASEDAGFARKEDLNDGVLRGYLGYETMSYEGDARRSSYVSFIKAPGAPENLTVETGALAHRILVDREGRAHGVEYAVGDIVKTATAAREIVLCAGALETPKLLMLSGIGPTSHLERLGIEVVLDQAEVGENLHDHPNVTMFHQASRETDCSYPQLYGFHRANPEMPLPPEQADTCYVFYTARSSLHQATLRMLPAILLPAFLYDVRAVKLGFRRMIDLILRFPPLSRWLLKLYGIVVILGKPVSRGTVRLGSRDPGAPPLVDPRYFEDQRDMDALIAGVKIGRRIAAAPALRAWGNTELGPGRWRKSDRAIARWIQNNAMTTFHFCGTCRMGADTKAPVDTRLRLRGVRGVRIADASVVPSVPVSAMNAPSMLIGYRAARFIREDIEAAAVA